MENIPEFSILRAGELSKKYRSTVFVTYIIGDEVFDEVSKYADHVLSTKQKKELFQNLIDIHRKNAGNSVYPDINEILDLEKNDFSVDVGKYHEVVRDNVESKNIDLVIMEYQEFLLTKFRILDRSSVPIWIERNEGPIEKIGLFCTNLAPNLRSPRLAKNLSKKYNAELSSFFIQDPTGKIDRKLSKKLSSDFNIQFNDVVDEKIEDALYRISKEMDLDLVILGRIRKSGYLDMRSKFAKKTHCSVLLIN